MDFNNSLNEWFCSGTASATRPTRYGSTFILDTWDLPQLIATSTGMDKSIQADGHGCSYKDKTNSRPTLLVCIGPLLKKKLNSGTSIPSITTLPSPWQSQLPARGHCFLLSHGTNCWILLLQFAAFYFCFLCHKAAQIASLLMPWHDVDARTIHDTSCPFLMMLDTLLMCNPPFLMHNSPFLMCKALL